MFYNIWILLFFFFVSFNSWADVELQEVLVASPIDEKENDLQQKQTGTSVTSTIQSYSSLMSLTPLGNTNFTTPIFIRGLDSKHTVVTLDGMALKDPSSIDYQVNLSVLDSSELSLIDLQLGSEGALNNSSAVGGVLAFNTGDHKRSYVEGDYGVDEKIGFSHIVYTSLSKLMISGFLSQNSDQIKGHAKHGAEKDGFQNNGLSLKLIHAYKSNLVSQTFVKLNEQNIDLDPNPFVDGNHDVSVQKYTMANHKTTLQQDEINYSQHRISYLKSDRLQKTDYGNYNFLGNNFQNQLTWSKGSRAKSVVTNLYYEHNRIVTNDIAEASTSLIDFNIKTKLKWNHNRWSLKSNLISHSEFEKRGLLTTSYKRDFLKKYSVTISAANTYNPPSLYQLYGPSLWGCKVGNSRLQPELGHSYEVNLARHSHWQEMSIKAFSTKVSDYINYNCQKGYQNELELITKGVDIDWKIWRGNHSFESGLTFLNFELSSGEKLLRRPKEKAVLTYTFKQNDRVKFWARGSYIGRRWDTDNVNKFRVHEIKLLDMGCDFLLKTGQFQVAVNNVTDEDDSLVYGFNGRGRILRINYKYFY